MPSLLGLSLPNCRLLAVAGAGEIENTAGRKADDPARRSNRQWLAHTEWKSASTEPSSGTRFARSNSALLCAYTGSLEADSTAARSSTTDRSQATGWAPRTFGDSQNHIRNLLVPLVPQ